MKRVLVVDDDPAVAKSIQRVLERAGYVVVLARDGREAEARFAPQQTDLVLLDLNLPFESGWDIFERLTAREPCVPIIIVTAMPNQFAMAQAAGVGALIEKPIEVPALLKLMNDLLTEPPDARLRRMCGFQHDTAHLVAAREQERRARARGRGFMKTTLLRIVFCVLACVLVSGCSALHQNTSSKAWSQVAARENDQQHFNSSTQNDEFYPFGAP